MHEIGLANDIVRIVVEQARRLGASEVLSANVQVGRLMAVEIDNLQYGLDVLKEQFPETRNTEFFLTEESIQVRCKRCGRTSTVADFAFTCMACGSGDVRVIAGETLEVTEMEVNDDLGPSLEAEAGSFRDEQ